MEALLEKTEKFWEEINKVRENYKKIEQEIDELGTKMEELGKENRGSHLILSLIFKYCNLEEELDRLDEEKKNLAITNQKHKEELEEINNSY